MDYDIYNPDGSLTSQIVVEMADVPESFDVNFKLQIATNYNGKLLSGGELAEVKLD